MRPSTGSVGNAYDDAMAEALFATLECGPLDRQRFCSHAEGRVAVFYFIEGFCNSSRRHSGIGYPPTINFERVKMPEIALADPLNRPPKWRNSNSNPVPRPLARIVEDVRGARGGGAAGRHAS